MKRKMLTRDYELLNFVTYIRRTNLVFYNERKRIEEDFLSFVFHKYVTRWGKRRDKAKGAGIT